VPRGVVSRLVLVVLGGLLLGPGAGRVAVADAPGPAGRGGPRPDLVIVVDANGREVGVVFAITYLFPVTLLRADGRDAALGVYADRLVPYLARARYESGDCSGSPWIVTEDPIGIAVPVAEPATIGRGNVLLVANGDPQARTFGSGWEQHSTPPACLPTPLSSPEIGRPTRVLLDLQQFTPPFRLR
jgi:hypothetical protein